MKLPDALYEGVKSLLAEKEKVAALQRQRAAAEALTAKIFENQARVRQNLESLVKVQSSGGLVQRYLADLERDEDAIAEARALACEAVCSGGMTTRAGAAAALDAALAAHPQQHAQQARTALRLLQAAVAAAGAAAAGAAGALQTSSAYCCW